MHYADSSLLVSYYIADANSARATLLVEASTLPFAFTDLHRLEVRNAFALAVFLRQITVEQSDAAWKDVESDLAVGLLHPVSVVWSDIFARAEATAHTLTPGIGSRSLDILHVAAALHLGIAQFHTFDGRQASLAERMGMSVIG